MNQALLPFGDPMATMRVPRARRSDPETSHAAARRARIVQHAHAAAILRVLEVAPLPLNAYAIAEQAGITQVQVARRMHELIGAQLVVVDGESERGRCYRLAGDASA